MDDKTLEHRLQVLENQIMRVYAENQVVSTFVGEFVYSAMISGKLSPDWVEQRIADSRNILEKSFNGKSDPLSTAYQANRSNDALSELTEDVKIVRELLDELNLARYRY